MQKKIITGKLYTTYSNGDEAFFMFHGVKVKKMFVLRNDSDTYQFDNERN